MLSIFINKTPYDNKGFENYVSDRFDDEFEKDWFNNEFVKRIIEEIDDTEVVSDVCLRSKVLGSIPPEYLSSGCKGLILLYMTDIAISGDRLGDNCVSLLLEIANNAQDDKRISLSHIPPFPDKFTARIENTNEVINSVKEFVTIYTKVMSDG